MKQCTRTNDNDSSMHKTKLHTLIGKAVSDTRQLSLPRRLRSLVIEGRRRVIKCSASPISWKQLLRKISLPNFQAKQRPL